MIREIESLQRCEIAGEGHKNHQPAEQREPDDVFREYEAEQSDKENEGKPVCSPEQAPIIPANAKCLRLGSKVTRHKNAYYGEQPNLPSDVPTERNTGEYENIRIAVNDVVD